MTANKDDDAGKPYGLAEQNAVRVNFVHVSLELTQAVEHPTAVFTGGQPGAGKSSAIVGPVQDDFDSRGGIVVVDPDELRPEFPSARAEMAKGGSEFSPAAYQAAGKVAFDVSMDLIAHKRNVLRDGTLADITYPRREMETFHNNGYRVEVHIAAVYQELSWARTVLRQHRDAELSESGFGRGVGREFHDKAVSGVTASTKAVWNEKIANAIVIYDGQGEKIMETTRGQSGEWQKDGKAHAGPTPDAIVAERQSKPQGHDLVAAANTWLDVRDLVTAKDRPNPAPEATIADVERQTGKALDAVAGDKSAIKQARNDDRLQAALEVHAKEPHRAAAQAWVRDPVEARKNWPEHAQAFDSAIATVNQITKVAQDVGQKDMPDPRQFLAGKLAKGEVSARPDPTPAIAEERQQQQRQERDRSDRGR